MGIMSLVMLAVIGIAWGQVPVNPQRMKHRYSEALVAFAGPAMNLILFFAFCLLAAISALLHVESAAVSLLVFGAMLNMVLFLLNLLPIPTLDGFAISRCIFPKFRLEKSELMKGMIVITFIMILMFARYFFMAGLFAAKFMTGVFIFLLNATGMF